MKNTAGYKFVGFVNRFVLLVACGAFVVGAAYSQGTGGPGGNSGSCTVTQLSLRFATSNDDLRGGQDNLNIVVYFTNRTSQIALNVNGSNPWHNNSVNLVYIHIKPPVPPNEIRAFRLVHVADGSINWKDLLVAPGGPINPINIATALQSPDNWNMADMEVTAVGNGVDARIASYGSHRFTGSNPDLIVGTHIPPNICGSGRPTNNSGGQGQVSVGNSGGGSGTLLAPSQQQGMLAAQPRSAALFQGNRVASKVTSVPNSPSTKGTVGDGNRSSGASGAASAGSGGPNTGAGLVPGKKLTNEDVVAMLSQRVQEQTILQRIQSSPSAFDVSSGARAIFDRECLAGRPANETPGRWAAEVRKIWDTMTNVVICRQTNGRGGEGACAPSSGMNNGSQKADELSPQPYPPKGTSTLTGGGGKPGTTVGTAGQPTRRPTPLQLNALLAKLRSTRGKASPIITNPAAGQANSALIATLRQQKQVAVMERGQSSGSSGRASPSATPPTPSGGALSSRVALSGAALSNINVACGTFSSAIIVSVSGQSGSAAVFTQDPAYNPFTIKGCHFGNVKGQAQLNWPNGRKLADLTIDSWTDSQVTVEVDPALVDVLDQPNITLVLFPANGPEAQKSGFRFFAMRRELLLSSIPSSEVTLAPITDDSGGQVTARFSGPYQLSSGNLSGGVDRSNVVRFPGGTDAFDFSKLKPGFVLERYQVTTLSDQATVGSSACSGFGPTTSTAYTDGNWAWQMTGNTIQVTWKEDHCHDAFNGDFSAASYALNVWVVGPVLSSSGSPWQ